MARSVATWFGSPESPLMGWLHSPPGNSVRGGVVICPAYGKELMSATRASRVLAGRLSRAGFLVLRFDYRGTGDSAGSRDDKDQLRSWQDSIVEAIDFVRGFGVQDVSLVGLRLGALLIASCQDRCGPLRSLVLWDPVSSARGYMREQQVMRSMTLAKAADPTGGDVEGLGVVYNAQTVADMRNLAIDAVSPSDVGSTGEPDVLLLVRPDRMAEAPTARLLASPDVVTLEAPGQRSFLDVPSNYSALPSESIDQIVNFIAARASTSAVGVDVGAQVRREAVVARADDGREVVETITTFGPDRLFGVLTRAVLPGAVEDPKAHDVQIFITAGVESHVGPVGLWVDIARAAAEKNGTYTVRFDRRGIAETAGDDEEGIASDAHSAVNVADTAAVIAEVRPQYRSVTVIGHCSGAWAAGRAAVEAHPDRVVLVALLLWALVPVTDGMIDPALAEAGEPEAVLVWKKPLSRRIREVVKRLVPYRVWLRLGSEVPEHYIGAILDAGAEVRMIMSDLDMVHFGEQRGPEGLKRLGEPGRRVDISSAADIDHALFDNRGREFVSATLMAMAPPPVR